MTSKYQAINQRLTRLERNQAAVKGDIIENYLKSLPSFWRFVVVRFIKRKVKNAR